jgi:hypothetical protein
MRSDEDIDTSRDSIDNQYDQDYQGVVRMIENLVEIEEEDDRVRL